MTDQDPSRRGLFGLMSASAIAAMIPTELQAAPGARKEWRAYIDAVPGVCNADYLERAIKILPAGTMPVLRGEFTVHRSIALRDVGDFSIAGEGEAMIKHIGPPTSPQVVLVTGLKTINWDGIGICGSGHDVGLMLEKCFDPVEANEYIYSRSRIYGGGVIIGRSEL